MRLLSLEVENFRAIRSARLQFGPGLNVVHGPNDRGKSTLTEAVRAVLLVAPGSAEARTFATWNAAAGQAPTVSITFEYQGATWKLEKVFAQGGRAKASLDKSTDGGTRYQPHAQGRDVEGKLRDLLQWGLAAPGGRGAAHRSETFLTTALLGKQGAVSAIFEASLKGDQDDTGRTLVTRALDALGQDPLVTKLLDRLKDRTGEVYTARGNHKRSMDSPLVRAQSELRDREERVRALEEAARQGKEIEHLVVQLLQARERALELSDQARAHLAELRTYQGVAGERARLDRELAQCCREFERVTHAVSAIDAVRRECEAAQAELATAEEEQTQAAHAVKLADEEAIAARDRLARARSVQQSSEELAAGAREVRLSELRVQLERAAGRRAAAQTAVAARTELALLESRLIEAGTAVEEAKQEVARCAAELNFATVWEEMQQARGLTSALESAVLEHRELAERERAAAAAVNQAEGAVKQATAKLEAARELDQQARTAGDERAMKLRLLDARILHTEAAIRDEREAVERAQAALSRMDRAEKAQAAAAAADAIATEIDASLADNAAELSNCEEEARQLNSLALELRRRALASKVAELSAQEHEAHEARRRAAELRDRAARLEAEAASVRLPSAQQLASIAALQAAIESRKSAGPGAPAGATALPLLGGLVAAAVGFALAWFASSGSMALSIGAALVLGVAVGAIIVLSNTRRQRGMAEAIWRTETGKLESQLAGETASVLREAGVTALERVEAKRQEIQQLRSESERSRQEAGGLDRQADAMLSSSADVSSLRRELATIVEELAVHGNGSAASQAGLPDYSQEALRDRNLRARERLENAHRARTSLQNQQVRQVVTCASARAQADHALADLKQGLLPGVEAQVVVVEAEARLRKAEAQMNSLHEESRRMTAPALAPDVALSGKAVSDAKDELAGAGSRLEERRRERQTAADYLARAGARLDLARHAAETIATEDIERRLAAAQAAIGIVDPPADRAAASARCEQAKQRLSNASAAVELQAAAIPAMRRKAEMLESAFPSGAASELESAEEEERRLQVLLPDAEAAGSQPNRDAASESQAAELAAAQAEHALTGAKALADSATARRDELRARVERARGDLEASERQMAGMDIEGAQQALAKARQALAELNPVPDVTAEQLLQAGQALEHSEAELKECEGSLNEVRGKLDLVGGRVGIERLEEEREALQRGREHAEDQELNYEASRHVLELLEAAEAKRSSHLGRSLAAPITERFKELAGDLYAHVNLDPDLRLEGFVSLGGEHRVEELSVGTREQLATLIRLAIAAQLKTVVLLDDQLVHSDSRRIEWFRKQVRHSVCEHGHQVIVMTCRPSDYDVDNEALGHPGELLVDRASLTVVNILDVVQRISS